MIKIAFVIDTIESPTAGTEKQLILLIKHLDRSKFQPYLCVLRTSKWLQEEFDLCPLYVSNINSFKNVQGLSGIILLSQYLKNNGIRIVQTHFRDSTIAGTLAAKIANVERIIGTRRNQGYWMTYFELQIQKLLNRWVNLIVTNSFSTKNWVSHVEDISNDNIRVIYNGIEVDEYLPLNDTYRDAFRKKLGIPLDAPVVGIIANLRPVKGIDIFIKAADIVRRCIPETRFIIVGNGDELDQLKGMVTEFGLSSQAFFLGRRLDIPELLSIFDVGVLSSHSESLSNSIIEYLAAGLPVVCTDVGGAREMVDNGVNGFIVPARNYEQIASSVIEILRCGKREMMGLESRKRAEERFSLQVMIDQNERLYTDILC